MPEHHHFEVETEQPNNATLVMWGFVVIILFFGSGIVLSSLFKKTTEALIYSKVLSQPSPQLLELRAQEEEKLTTYGWVDKDKQVVRIPIERAMQLQVEEAH